MDQIKQLYELTGGLNILFVEDDTQLRAQMEGIFGELFRHVDTAENGQEGLQKYKERLTHTDGAYDLIITDINMPLMNGIEMVRAIHETNLLQPILVVSAHNDSDYLMELMDIGISSFLIKPVQHEAFIKTLYKVTKSIINERLIEKHYKEIEGLNAELYLKTEELKKRNIQMHEKNIALEKSMRIIEGMQHKDQLQRKITIPHKTSETFIQQDKTLNPSQSHLQNIEKIISMISLKQPLSEISDASLHELSEAVNIYAHTLTKETLYQDLSLALKELAINLKQQPKYSSRQDLERIFSILESFFFIYRKWENEWKNIDIETFESFSNSIEDEIAVLIDVWNEKA